MSHANGGDHVKSLRQIADELSQERRLVTELLTVCRNLLVEVRPLGANKVAVEAYHLNWLADTLQKFAGRQEYDGV